VLALAFALVACSGSDDEDSGDTGTSTAAAGTATSAATSAASATATTAGNGSDSNDSGGTADGDATAHNAMISEDDLPGGGWTVISTDEFGDSLLDADDSDLSDLPSCKSYVDKINQAAEKANQSRTGRASKSFEKTDALLGASVDVEVAVYKDSKSASDLVSEAKSAFGSNDFEDCFRDVIKGSEGEVPEDVQFNLETSNPATSAPHDGVAQAFELELSAAGQTFSLHAELYAWADDKATAFVTVFGTPDTVDADLVKAAVGKVSDKVSAAQ
jgi:hypothetical protein